MSFRKGDDFLSTLQTENFCVSCIPLEMQSMLGERYVHHLIQDTDLLFFGRINLLYMAQWWSSFVAKLSAGSYKENLIYEALKEAKTKIDSAGSFDSGLDEQYFETVLTRAEKANESLCEQIKNAIDRRDFLKRLAMQADDKPLIFDIGDYQVGEDVTVFVADSMMEFGEDPKFIYGKVNHVSNFFEGGVVESVRDNWVQVKLDDKIYDGSGSTDKIEIPEDSFGILKRRDFDYFSGHPDFYKMYLDVRSKEDMDVREAITVLQCAVRKGLSTSVLI